MDFLSGQYKYYFYSKKRNINNQNFDVSAYNENKYCLIKGSDDMYIHHDVINGFIVNKHKIQIYNDIDSLNNYDVYDSIEEFNESQNKEENTTLLKLNNELFLNDVDVLIQNYNNRTYDCIEVMLPNIKSYYYEDTLVQALIIKLHNAFPNDASVYEKIINN